MTLQRSKLNIVNFLTGGCPRCAGARVLHGLGRVDTACSSCGLNLSRVEVGDGVAVLLIFVLGTVVTPLALWAGMNTDWPTYVHGIVWGAVVLGGTFGLLAPAKSLLLHLQYRNKPEDFK